MNSYRNSFFQHINDLQEEICKALENLDGKAKFKEDVWKRKGGGGGRSRVISDGHIFEKGGVNISGVHGELPDSMTKYLKVSNNRFFACGISLVLHPINPFIPTVHANFRYFELYDKNGAVVDQWFAGGADLTPYYVDESDIVHFHKTWKVHCDLYEVGFYSKYKEACDSYFYNHHREEARGVGGLFFDYLRPTDLHSSDFWRDFTVGASQTFLNSYVPIVENQKTRLYTENHKEWQEIRRGRYVEFNLIHDKGTLFGLKTKGRIESIFMSLPPKVRWEYDYQVKEDTEEAKLLEVLKNPINWLDK